MTEWTHRYLDAWNSHEPAQVGAYMADDAVYEDLALGQLHEGRPNIEAFVGSCHQFSADYRFTSVSEQAAGARYAVEWELAGTNTGEIGGLPVTNKPYRIRGVSIGQLDDGGRIKQNRDYWNLADYLMQVGVLPPPLSG